MKKDKQHKRNIKKQYIMVDTCQSRPAVAMTADRKIMKGL